MVPHGCKQDVDQGWVLIRGWTRETLIGCQAPSGFGRINFLAAVRFSAASSFKASQRKDSARGTNMTVYTMSCSPGLTPGPTSPGVGGGVSLELELLSQGTQHPPTDRTRPRISKLLVPINIPTSRFWEFRILTTTWSCQPFAFLPVCWI